MRNLSFRALTAVAGVALLVSACGESADESDAAAAANGDGGDDSSYVFAAVPSEEATSLEQEYDTTISYIEEVTGSSVEFQQATDYAAVIEGMRAGQIDFTSYGPFSYVISADSGIPMQPLGSLVDAPDEEPGYHSGLWVPADSEYQDISEAEGQTVCFVDRASTSGFLYPSAGPLEEDIDLEEDIEQVLAGGHDASVLSTLDGTCDMGFAYEEMINQLIDSGQIEEGDVRQIWQSENIMGSPLAVQTETVDQEVVDELVTAFEDFNIETLVEMGICENEEDCSLPENSEWGMVPVTDSDYDGVRAVCDVTQAEACEAA